MANHEYRILTEHVAQRDDLAREMNELGAQGFRLSHMAMTSEAGSDWFYIVMEREVVNMTTTE